MDLGLGSKRGFMFQIKPESMERLAEYEAVPIAFEVRSRLDIREFAQSGLLVEMPMERRWKNYDENLEERPIALASRHDMSSWGIFSAFEDGYRAGGIIVAPGGSGYEVLPERSNSATIVDLRVRPQSRGTGIGRALLERALAWAVRGGWMEILVETQDTNVPACRFYARVGFAIESIEPEGYGAGIDEARIIWALRR